MAVILKSKYGAIIHKPRDITLTQQSLKECRKCGQPASQVVSLRSAWIRTACADHNHPDDFPTEVTVEEDGRCWNWTFAHKDDPDTKARFEAAARAAFYVVSG